MNKYDKPSEQNRPLEYTYYCIDEDVARQLQELRRQEVEKEQKINDRLKELEEEIATQSAKKKFFLF